MSEQLQSNATMTLLADETSRVAVSSMGSAARSMALSKAAIDVLGGELKDHLQGSSPKVFAESYDPSLPTIGFDFYSIGTEGEALLAKAAMENVKIANIVHVDSGHHFGEYQTSKDGTTQLVAGGSAVITTPEGKFMPLRFPHEVPIDILISCESDVQSQAQRFGLPQIFLDNADVVGIPPSLQERYPQQYTRDQLADGLQDNFVIKPTDLFGGIGIGMFEPRHTKRALEYHDYLGAHHYDPIIEERLAGPLLKDPETGQKYAWNVRAIIADGKVMGGYIRAGARNGAVNKVVGARMIALSDLENFVGGRKPKRRAAMMEEAIWETAAHVAEVYPRGYLGPDIFVDTDYDGRLFEVNSNSAGGLDSIARVAHTRAEKIAPARAVIAQWLGRLGEKAADPQVEHHRVAQKTHIGVIAAMQAIRNHGNTQVLQELSLDDLSLSGGDSASIIRQCLGSQRATALRAGDKKKVVQIESLMRDQYPLHAHNLLPLWVADSPAPHEYMPYIAKLSRFLPHDVMFKKAFTILSARMFEGMGLVAIHE